MLIRILQQRAPDLGEHVNAVERLALAYGAVLGLSPGELTDARARLGAARHREDGDPRRDPAKAGPLDEEEWRFMRQHTVLGERIVAAASSLASVAKLIRASHERWDGHGYPDRLAGEEIPLAARIIFACDAFDAITAERPYSPAREPEDALEELRRCAGTQFDPRVVDVLEHVVRSTPRRSLPVSLPVGQPGISAPRPAASERPCRSAPRSSKSAVSAIPIPFGSGSVTASRQTHSPPGIRCRWTLRSTLMNRYRRQSRVALTPLPESAAASTRCSGRRLLAGQQRHAHPHPDRRRPGSVKPPEMNR